MTDAIVADGLTKRFGTVQALDALSFTVAEGTVMGLLGPNGSGKTTTVRVLSTLLSLDAGKATVAGYDVTTGADQLRRRIGLSGQYAAVDGDLTARENLELVGRLHHLGRSGSRRRAAELLDRFDLAEVAGRPVKGYSGGMQRRVDLACALVASPEVLFLDEPTTGLDPRSRQATWELVTELVAGGSTLLLTTQYLEEADRLADRIAVVDHGKLIATGTPDELKTRLGGERLELTVSGEADLAEARRVLAGTASGEITVDERSLQVVVPVTDGSAALLAAVRLLDDAGVRLQGTTVRRPSLDEVFFALTGQKDPAAEESAAEEAAAEDPAAEEPAGSPEPVAAPERVKEPVG